MRYHIHVVRRQRDNVIYPVKIYELCFMYEITKRLGYILLLILRFTGPLDFNLLFYVGYAAAIHSWHFLISIPAQILQRFP